MEPKVSVIIPTYNSAHFLNDAIDSVLMQTYQNIELIIVDDGSTDNTAYIVELCAQKDKRVSYVFQENGGQGKARNTGIKKSTGEYIALLDADDLWGSVKIEKQMRLFKDHPDVGLVYCNALCVNAHLQDVPQQPPFRKVFNGWVTKELIKQNFINNSSVLAKKKFLLDALLYNEKEIYRSIEDYDFWIRLSLYTQVFHLNETLLQYRYLQKIQTKKDLLLSYRKMFTMYYAFLRQYRFYAYFLLLSYKTLFYGGMIIYTFVYWNIVKNKKV